MHCGQQRRCSGNVQRGRTERTGTSQASDQNINSGQATIAASFLTGCGNRGKGRQRPGGWQGHFVCAEPLQTGVFSGTTGFYTPLEAFGRIAVADNTLIAIGKVTAGRVRGFFGR